MYSTLHHILLKHLKTKIKYHLLYLDIGGHWSWHREYTSLSKCDKNWMNCLNSQFLFNNYIIKIQIIIYPIHKIYSALLVKIKLCTLNYMFFNHLFLEVELLESVSVQWLIFSSLTTYFNIYYRERIEFYNCFIFSGIIGLVSLVYLFF